VYQAANVAAEVAAFFTDMGQRLGAAHLVISRAGASSVTELQVAGRPAILVPFAAAADDHQRKNADVLSAAGAAVMIDEKALSGSRLAEVVNRLLADRHRLRTMGEAMRTFARPDAAARIVDRMFELARA